MPLELFLTFVAATSVLIIVPGPVVTMVVANSLSYGPRYGLASVVGASSAVAIHLTIMALGMASVMAVLADWFEWLRWAGVAYLIYIGIQQWRAEPVALEDLQTHNVTLKALYWRGFLVGMTNPKLFLFYAAFFPQFIDPMAPAGTQLAVLCVTFLTICLTFDGAYALLAGRLRRLLTSHRRARLRNRLSGSLLVGAGLGLAFVRRT